MKWSQFLCLSGDKLWLENKPHLNRSTHSIPVPFCLSLPQENANVHLSSRSNQFYGQLHHAGSFCSITVREHALYIITVWNEVDVGKQSSQFTALWWFCFWIKVLKWFCSSHSSRCPQMMKVSTSNKLSCSSRTPSRWELSLILYVSPFLNNFKRQMNIKDLNRTQCSILSTTELSYIPLSMNS